MYASPFEYLRVTSWSEAVSMLQEHGDEAKVLAGGQSLVPMMNLRLVQASHIVDVNDAGGGGVSESDGMIEIDALTRHSELHESALLARACPLLSEAAALVGNVRVRHRGTIGGSLAHADPSAELPCALLAMNGAVRVIGPGGERRIPARDFFVSFFTTALEPSEVVVGVHVSSVPISSGTAFVEFVRRTGDFAVVGVAALVELDGGGVCTRVRVAGCGIGDRPMDLSDPASVLVGAFADDEHLMMTARSVAGAVNPWGDERASADYRRHLMEVLTRRALGTARDRARAGAV